MFVCCSLFFNFLFSFCDEQIADDALQALIGDYAREAGVRNLEKLIDKIFRKAAFKLVSGASKTVSVTSKKVGRKKWSVCAELCFLSAV
jgi:ATP-dependent Lon protease